MGILGLALNARLPGITDALAALPLFDIAVTDYLVFLWAAVHQQCRPAPEGCQEVFVGLHRVGDLEEPLTQRNRFPHFSCRQQRPGRFDQ